MIRYRNDCKLKPSQRSKLIKAKVDQCLEINRRLQALGAGRGARLIPGIKPGLVRAAAPAVGRPRINLLTTDADPLWPLEVHP